MQHEDVTATMWQEKCVVLLLSSNSDPRTNGLVTKKGKSNEETESASPQAVINYTKHMWGVDVSDQKREYYGVGRSSKKFWKFILHFVLNVCLVNCFFLYDLICHPPSRAHGNMQQTFQMKLGASADLYIHFSQAYRQEEKLAHRKCIPEPFPYFTKSIRPCKRVSFVYREKENWSFRKG